LQAKLASDESDRPSKGKGRDSAPTTAYSRTSGKAAGATATSRDGKPQLDLGDSKVPSSERARYVALDCEMVGLGPTGKQSALARACLVDYDGDVLYDQFVRPKGYVTDFRTKYSGVRQCDLRQGEAVPFEECQAAVAGIMKGKVLVGHALSNDTDAMMLSHPKTMVRDTARYRPLMRTLTGGEKVKYRPRALRELSKQHLGVTIQTGEHDPSVDARTAMMLYRKFRGEWETSLKQRSHNARVNSKDKAGGTDAGVPAEGAVVARKRPRSIGQSSKTRPTSASAGSSSSSSNSGLFGRSDGVALRSINDVDVSKGGSPAAAAAAVSRKKSRKGK